MDLSAALGKQQAISGATLGAPSAFKSGMHTQEGRGAGFKAWTRTHFAKDDQDHGRIPLEDVIHQMKGNTLNEILRATDEGRNENALADEQMQMRAIYTNDPIKY